MPNANIHRTAEPPALYQPFCFFQAFSHTYTHTDPQHGIHNNYNKAPKSDQLARTCYHKQQSEQTLMLVKTQVSLILLSDLLWIVETVLILRTFEVR